MWILSVCRLQTFSIILGIEQPLIKNGKEGAYTLNIAPSKKFFGLYTKSLTKFCRISVHLSNILS